MRCIPLAALLASLAFCSVALLGAGVRHTLEARDPAVEGWALGDGDPNQESRAFGAGFGDLASASGMRFGIDAASVGRFSEQAGGPPDYGTVWVGRWNLEKGWRNTDAALRALDAANVTPAVHFWYWGDDIQDACFGGGCNGKTVEGWHELTRQLTAHLQADLGGKPVLLILESEFNKHGVHDEEYLDQALALKVGDIKAGYPAAQVVLGFGNWESRAWGTFDRAAAASDYVGLQAMAASTRHDKEFHLGLADETVEGAERLHVLFDKPVVVQDVAVSSYPEPESLETQEEALLRFAASLPALREAGVEAVIYRSFLDVPDMALGNHFAEAERHWGLAWHDTGELKPAGRAWIQAIQLTRGGGVSALGA